MNTIQACTGKWDIVLANWGLEITGNRHIHCKLCNKAKKTLRINEYRDGCTFICTCSSGSIINYIMDFTGKSFAEIAKEIDSLIGNTHEKIERHLIPKPQQKTLSNLRDYRGTDTEIYLMNRGVKNMPEMSISHSDNEPYYNSDGKPSGSFPAMIAKIVDSISSEVLQLHITYLKSGKKVDRKVKGVASSTDFKTPCVKLFTAQKVLGLAEGIETALSAHDLYDIPTWATVNAGFMKKFRAPLGITELVIFADNDRSGTGHAAAFECARANLSANNDVVDVKIVWPSEIGDFNDIDDKENICSWSLSK